MLAITLLNEIEHIAAWLSYQLQTEFGLWWRFGFRTELDLALRFFCLLRPKCGIIFLVLCLILACWIDLVPSIVDCFLRLFAYFQGCSASSVLNTFLEFPWHYHWYQQSTPSHNTLTTLLLSLTLTTIYCCNHLFNSNATSSLILVAICTLFSTSTKHHLTPPRIFVITKCKYI